MAEAGTDQAPSGRRETRRTGRGFVLIAAATMAIVVAVIIFFAGFEGERESRFPSYWNELEEGELTREELVDRVGLPTDTEGDCLLYDDLVESQLYRFCFDEQGVLTLKAAA